MKLSTRGCYGLRAMVELARHYGGGPLLMRAISDKHGISRKYLHAPLTNLKTAGMVRSLRGAGGGYVLARTPATIQVAEVVRVLEGALSPAECVEDHGVCQRTDECVALTLWEQVNKAIEQVLGNISLADLLRQEAERKPAPASYDI